jgi:hypothetical protein
MAAEGRRRLGPTVVEVQLERFDLTGLIIIS